jgi:hypothetical protein
MRRLPEVVTFWFGFADRCTATDDGLLAVAVLGNATGCRSAEPTICRLLEIATFLSGLGDVRCIAGNDGLLAVGVLGSAMGFRSGEPAICREVATFLSEFGDVC